MSNLLKRISDLFIGPQGLLGPPRLPADTSNGKTYSRLRYQALVISRDQADIPTPASDAPIWGVLIETGYLNAIETLYAVSDGTTSLYFSNGDGVIGGHGHENVKKANGSLLKVANQNRHLLQATKDFPNPEIGYTVFYGLTDSGILSGGGTQESLFNGQHTLSDVFHTAHEAVIQLRMVVAEKEAKNASNGEDYYNIGVAHAAKGDFFHALSNYDKAIELNPNYVDAYINRGVAYGSVGNPNHAIAEFDKAVELNPGDSYVFYNRALAYSTKGDTNRSISDYSKAIELNSKYIEAYLNRGLLYKSLGHTSDAIKDFERFLEISTDSKARKLVEEELNKLKLT